VATHCYTVAISGARPEMSKRNLIGGAWVGLFGISKREF